MSTKEKGSKFVSEFKQFIARGNVVDMAVGVIVGGAFKSIVDSLTADLIMPFIGLFVKENSFANLSVSIGSATFTYGNFIQTVFNFLIMAFVVFMLVKVINRFHRKKEELPPAPPEPSSEEKLLMEIRDLLKNKEQ